MPFGILEDHKLDNIPGTGLFSDRGRGLSVAVDKARKLKRRTGKHSHVVLIPQPSDDPRDPLFVTTLAGSLSTIAAPAYVLLSQQFDTSVDDISSAFSAGLPGVAVFLLVQNTLAVKFGHRIVYLVSTFLLFISSIWTALSPNLASVTAARVIQGVGQAAPLCLVPTTLEQIFFVHERGLRSSLRGFALFSGLTLGPLLNAYVLQHLSWQLGFWFVSIACGLAFVGTFFVPEATFHRLAHLSISGASRDESTSGKASPGEKTLPRQSTESDVEICNTDRSAPSPSPPSFLSSLKVYNGTFSDESVWKTFLRPFPFLLSPVTWFVFLGLSMQSVWLSVVALCSSTIFSVTYGFNAVQTGLTNLGGIVGIVLAVAVSGPLIDSCVVWLSQRNRGIYEPEFRLVSMATMLFGVFGYIGWAVGNDDDMPWIGAVTCIAMLYFSGIVSGAAAVTYLLDTHGPNALHILSLTDSAKSFVLYSMVFFANGLVLRGGVKRTLLVLGACQAVCCLAAVPMYVYGKRVRAFIARHPRLFCGDLLASEFPGVAASTGADSKC